MQIFVVNILIKSYLLRKSVSSIIKDTGLIHSKKIFSNIYDFENEILNEGIPDLLVASYDTAELEDIVSVVKKYNIEKSVYISRKDIKSDVVAVIPVTAGKNRVLSVFDKIIKNDANKNKNDVLSEREKEIVKNIALGYTNQEIADRLFISPHTVITHRKNITKKLGIKSVSGLTVYAMLNNLVDIKDM